MIYTYDARILLAWFMLLWVPKRYFPVAMLWLRAHRDWFVSDDDPRSGRLLRLLHNG